MSLRSAPLHMSALFPDHIISKAEEEIRHFEDKCPGRLVGQSQIPPNLSPTYTDPSIPLSRVGLASEQRKIRTGTHTSFQFRRLPVRLDGGRGQAHTRSLADPTDKNTGTHIQSSMPGQKIDVSNRVVNSHRKAGTLRPVTHETHSVASQEQLESPGDNGKDHSHSKITPPTSEMVAGGKQCSYRSTITPTKTCSANLYRRIKRRVGRSLKQTHCKGNLVSSRKQVAHKPFGIKGSFSGPERIPRPLFKPHSPHSHRQHNSSCLYQQGRGG